MAKNEKDKRSRSYTDLIERFYKKDISGDVDRALAKAYIDSQSAPSMDMVDVIDAIVAYGDARVAEAKRKWKS